MTDLEDAARALDRAVAEPGRDPDYHLHQILRLQNEWPTMWSAIERVRRALHEGTR